MDRTLGYTSDSGRMIPDIAAALRSEVGRALRAAFGVANVKGGTKAFRVSTVEGSRADADVVPALRLDCVRGQGPGFLALVEPFRRIEGVIHLRGRRYGDT